MLVWVVVMSFKKPVRSYRPDVTPTESARFDTYDM